MTDRIDYKAPPEALTDDADGFHVPPAPRDLAQVHGEVQ